MAISALMAEPERKATKSAVLYLDIVNIAETSLHMHLLLEVAWNDRLSLFGGFGYDRVLATASITFLRGTAPL